MVKNHDGVRWCEIDSFNNYYSRSSSTSENVQDMTRKDVTFEQNTKPRRIRVDTGGSMVPPCV